MKAVAIVALGLAGCQVCGTYSYRGYEVEEHCGAIYGTEGVYYEGNDVVQLNFASSAPVDRPGLSWGWTGEPVLTAFFHADDLVRGTVLGADDVVASCSWVEAPGPHEMDDVVHSGPPTDFELEVGAKVADLEFGGSGPLRRFTWFIECDDGEVWSEGRDAVRLRATTGSSAALDG